MMGNRQQPMNESTPMTKMTTTLKTQAATLKVKDLMDYLDATLIIFEPFESDFERGFEDAILDVQTHVRDWLADQMINQKS
jgi:hypothetical protein